MNRKTYDKANNIVNQIDYWVDFSEQINRHYKGEKSHFDMAITSDMEELLDLIGKDIVYPKLLEKVKSLGEQFDEL